MTLKIFSGLVLATLMTCSFVWVRLEIVKVSYDINSLTSLEKTLRDDCNKLTLKINESKSLSRLENLAKKKFNLGPPRPDQLITIGN